MKRIEEKPTVTPQENMSRILWSFFKGSYHMKNDLLGAGQVEENVKSMLNEAVG